MTLPILPFLGGGDAHPSSGSPSSGAEPPAGLAFGALLSAAGAVPVERRTPVPEPSLELLLEGEWMLDEEAGDEGPGRPVEGKAAAATSASGEVIVLEKDLSDWLTGRAGGRSAGRVGVGQSPELGGAGREAAAERLGLELDGAGGEATVERVGLEHHGAGRHAAAERTATVFGVDTASRAAPSIWQGATEGSGQADQRTVETVGREPASESPGSIDAETASREFRALSALIEVAGFVFPIGSEPVSSPVADSGADAVPTRPPLPGETRQGTGDPPLYDPGRLTARPVEQKGLTEEVETRSWRFESAELAKPGEEPREGVLRKHAAQAEPAIRTEVRGDARGPVADSRGSDEAVAAPAERLARRVVFERGTEAAPDGQPLGEGWGSRGAAVSRASGGERGGPADGGRGNGERGPTAKRDQAGGAPEPAAPVTRTFEVAGHGARVETASMGQTPAGEPTQPARMGDGSIGDSAGTARTFEPRLAPRADRVTVELADDLGDIGRLRLSVHGPSLRATIVPATREVGGQLEAGMHELTRSLTERGFSDARVTVQRSTPTDPTPAAHPTGREVLVAARTAESGAGYGPGGDRAQAEPDRREPEQHHQERAGGQRRDRSQQERHQRGRNS